MNISRIISITGFLCLFLTLQSYGQQVSGVASYYHDSLAGLKMANGSKYNPEAFTCAHLNYPLGTVLKVTRKDNPEKSVMVVVTDRGPYIKGRVIDLSKRAAREIGILRRGIAEVMIALVQVPDEDGIALQ